MAPTVTKVIDFPRYKMKCSGENEILRGIVHAVPHFPLHFMLYRGNLNYFLESAPGTVTYQEQHPLQQSGWKETFRFGISVAIMYLVHMDPCSRASSCSALAQIAVCTIQH